MAADDLSNWKGGNTVFANETLEPYSLAGLLKLLIRSARLLVVVSALCAVATATVLLILPRSYSSVASFAPQGAARQGTQFSGIAAQLGVALPGTDLSSSPQFFADLAKSRTLLRGLVDSLKVTPTDGSPQSIASVYHVKGKTAGLLRETTIDKLLGSIVVTAVQRTGVVQVTVTAPDPAVARQINTALLASLNGFNLHRRQSQASAERAFVERRLAEARADVRGAENKLQAFLQENRTYSGAPQLRFVYDRLEADVSLRQSVVLTLSQLFEQSRVDEVRDTPVITVIEPPIGPVRPDRRNLVSNTMFAAVAGCLVALFVVIGAAYWRSLRAPAAADT